MADLSRLQIYLKELSELTDNPIHKRLINAYEGDNPKESVESELGQISKEALEDEN